MKKRTFVLLLCWLSVSMIFGQSKYYERCQKLLQAGDTAELSKVLPEWEKAESSNGDVYAAWFNYYLQIARSESLSLSKQKPDGKGIAIQDSTGKVVAYIGGQTTYGEKGMRMGIAKLDEGIAKSPDRVDLSFGKVHLLLTEHDYDEALKELHRVLDRSLVNKNEWKWTHDQSPARDGEGQLFLKECLQDYFTQLYNDRKDSIAMVFVDDVLQHYPNSIFFLSDKASIYARSGQMQEALDLFLKVHELDPSDNIVTLNIGAIYLRIDEKKAKSYFAKLAKSKDPELSQAAKEALKELKK